MAVKRSISYKTLGVDSFDDYENSILTLRLTVNKHQRSGVINYFRDKWDLVDSVKTTEKFLRSEDGEWYRITEDGPEAPSFALSPLWFMHHEPGSLFGFDPIASAWVAEDWVEGEWQQLLAAHKLKERARKEQENGQNR